jgi:hypothetical protein
MHAYALTLPGFYLLQEVQAATNMSVLLQPVTAASDCSCCKVARRCRAHFT